MNPKIERFFMKHSILPEDIKYIIRENGSTEVYTIDGRIVSTYHPVKDFKEHLPVEDFLYPNKGIIAAASQIVDVSNGFYEMADGRTFKYRIHNSKLHDTRLLMLGRKFEHTQAIADSLNNDSLPARLSIFDNMPLAACVIELQMDEQNFSADFLFRYCNKAMADFESLSPQEILGKSFMSVFTEADPKWLVAYMDVALNNTVRIIEDYNKERKQQVKIYCYQPAPGYCACVLTEIPQEPFEGPRNRVSAAEPILH